MIDFSRLYAMGVQGKRTALHVRPRDGLESVSDENKLYRGTYRLANPLAFKYFKGASGSTAYDFVSTSLSPLVLISERVIKVLQSFNGWTTYPVEVYGKKDELITGYHGLAVTGRCGPIDDGLSVPRIVPPPCHEGRGLRQWFGLFFAEKTWDGSDIFVPEGTSLTCVTKAVKLALEKANITNVEFTPLTEMVNPSVRLLEQSEHEYEAPSREAHSILDEAAPSRRRFFGRCATMREAENYWLTSAEQSDGLQVTAREDRPLSLIRGEAVPSEPIVFERDYGRRLYDVLRTTTPGQILVSERFVDTLRQHGFTGWATYPVEVYGQRDRLTSGYHGLSVTGRCGPIDFSRCEWTTRNQRMYYPDGPLLPESQRRPYWLGLYFDLKTWDGSDFFSPESSLFQLVRPAVRIALERAGITNVCFEPIGDIEFVPHL